MLILKIISALLWLAVIPWILGMVPASMADRKRKYKLLPGACGYVCMWAIFQFICVPLVLLQKRNGKINFQTVVWTFGLTVILWLLASLSYLWKTRKQRKLHAVSQQRGNRTVQRVLWCVFGILLLAQVLCMIFMAFGDGDDAYYMAVSALTENSNTMYMNLPYTGGATELNTRYGLAPMPVWIAFIARVSGLHVAAIAQIFVPVVLLLLTYGIYEIIGQILCRDKKEMLPVYMIGVSLLIVFGNYSFKTAETFLITRTGQGKSVLGNVILPFLFVLLFMLIDRIREQKEVPAVIWLLFIATAGAGCLCSTLGGVLIVMLLGIAGFFISICYKKIQVLLGLAGCCFPALVYIALYLFVQRV